MVQRPYEISLWTYNDRFLSVLVASDAPKLKEGYEPRWYDGINGEKKLTFTIPIKYFSTEDDSFIDNEKWYNELKQSNSLANEKKVKLIFNKLEKNLNGAYVHEIHEFIIENLTEERNERELLCRVECIGAAFKELGKTGTEISLNLDTMLLEEENTGVQKRPTINYWLDKVFPASLPNDSSLQWGYEVNISNNINMPVTKIYEVDLIEDWQLIENVLTPIYAVDPIEKERFIDVKDSNRYNIVQDIAETFQVFVDYIYLYQDPNQPFRATAKRVLFYDKLVEPSEYSITYGNNELGLSKNSGSADVTTKMFVAPIESEYSDDGFVTITKAKNNKTQDNFILNFDYFIQSGQMSSVQIAAIPIFEREVRVLNLAIGQTAEDLAALEHDISLLKADISNLENKYNAANDNVIDIEDKLLAFDAALSTYTVQDKDVLNTAKADGSTIICTLRRSGVKAPGLSVKKSDGTLIAG